MNQKPLFDQVNEPFGSYKSLPKGLELVLKNREELIQLCKKHQLKSLFIFGSSLEENFSDTSDIDFLVEFKELPFDLYTDHYFNLHEELESLLGRKIDLVTVNSLANKYFKEKVLSSRKLLYAA